MKLHQPRFLKEFMAEEFERRKNDPTQLFLFPFEGSSCDDSIKSLLCKRDLAQLQDVWLIVGSEGGFSHQEVTYYLKSLGLPTLTLGEQVLRVETACIALCSILKYEFSSF